MTNYFRWITDHDRIGWDVLCHNGRSSHYCALADPHTFEDGRVESYPGIILITVGAEGTSSNSDAGTDEKDRLKSSCRETAEDECELLSWMLTPCEMSPLSPIVIEAADQIRESSPT
jgi:hypothetical protein